MRKSITAPREESEIPKLFSRVHGGSSVDALLAWLTSEEAFLDAELMQHGALLFRGYEIGSVESFAKICERLCPQMASYVGVSRHRTKLTVNIYTTTHYPQQNHIPLHIECSYLPNIPNRLFFCCVTPPANRGQTPVGDMRLVLQKIDPAVRGKFERHGVTYVNNMHGGHGFSRSWMDTFETNDRKNVEQILQASSYQFEWKADGSLRTIMTRPAIGKHHQTGQLYWLNQVANWHPSEFDTEIREQLLSVYGDDNNLPKNATFSDGSPIPDEDVNHVRDVLRAHENMFTWEAGDLLVIDNQWIAHGRKPYTGERQILVAMN